VLVVSHQGAKAGAKEASSWGSDFAFNGRRCTAMVLVAAKLLSVGSSMHLRWRVSTYLVVAFTAENHNIIHARYFCLARVGLELWGIRLLHSCIPAHQNPTEVT
jgi:hypothetical protein